jgi:outer membrane receptor for Fe3+-dicitrate
MRFETKDENPDELMQVLALHAEKANNMKTVPTSVTEKKFKKPPTNSQVIRLFDMRR